MSIFLAERVLPEKCCIEKCYRNVPFTAFGPWLLYGTWLTLIVSSDWVTDSALKNLARAFSVLYATCNTLQSIMTSPGLYSTFMRYSMRFLPHKCSPAYDPVTLWKKWEVLERYKLRKEKNWRNKTTPWTTAHPAYVPMLIRERLRSNWTRKYAQIRMNRGCSKSRALYEVYLLEFGNEHAHMCPETISDQFSSLFRQWAIRTYERDPQQDASISEKAEMERLHSEFCELWYSSMFLRPPGIPKVVNRGEYYASLANYINLSKYNPLQSCPLSVTDCYGNTRRLEFMRTPVDILDTSIAEDMRYPPSTEEVRKEEKENRGKDGGTFDHWWMLTREQKRAVQVQEYEDNLWATSKLNYDYMERSKAL
ncbi:hypothetical protein Aduo_013243 [Ancylostoma duodenale]